MRQWDGLHGKLKELGATIDLVPPVPGLPDLVFTANAAVVLDRQVLLARFRHPERQAEEPHFEAAFRALQAHGLVDIVRKLPDGLVLEGAGDCVWDDTRKLITSGRRLRHFDDLLSFSAALIHLSSAASMACSPGGPAHL